LERYLRVNLLGPGPRLIKKKKRIYRAAVSQRLRNTDLDGEEWPASRHSNCTPRERASGTHYMQTLSRVGRKAGRSLLVTINRCKVHSTTGHECPDGE